jgi:hypothetical protein
VGRYHLAFESARSCPASRRKTGRMPYGCAPTRKAGSGPSALTRWAPNASTSRTVSGATTSAKWRTSVRSVAAASSERTIRASR